MKKFFWIFLLIPSLTQARFADEVNKFLDFFFQPKASQKEMIPEDREPVIQIPDIEIPDKLTDKDLTEIRQKIMVEEAELSNFKSSLDTARQELWQAQNTKQSLEDQLKILDEDISLQQQKIEKLTEQQRSWQDRLEQLTKEKSELKALIRIAQDDLEETVITQSVRDESLSQDQNLSVLKWLFSKQTMSHLLEEQWVRDQKKKEKKQMVRSLDKAQQSLEAKERHAALLFHRIQELNMSLMDNNTIIRHLADGKARLRARLEFSEGKLQKEIDNWSREHTESLAYLQNLRSALGNIEEKLQESDESKNDANFTPLFDFPLSIPIKVSARFQDPEYKKEFGKDHNGVDFVAPQGTDIIAPSDGMVRKVVHNGYGYSYFVLEHDKDLYTVYGHVSDIFVNEGQQVEKGKLIGKTGGTPGTLGAGFFTAGPHLHFEVFSGGKFVNPFAFLPTIKE